MRSLFYILFFLPLLSVAQDIETIAGNAFGSGGPTYPIQHGSYSGDGAQAINAGLHNPDDIVFDSHGNMYFTDRYNNVVRKIDTNGIITTFAGNGDSSGSGNFQHALYSGDGGPATEAQLNFPTGLAIDADDNIYIADLGNYLIRKVTPQGIITRYAGTYHQYVAGGSSWQHHGDGTLALDNDLSNVWDICVDTHGNLFYIDRNMFIRKVAPSGITTTIAGSGSGFFSGDGGPAINATLMNATSLTIDKHDNIYFAVDDGVMERYFVLKIDTAGIIHKIAGNGVEGTGGDGGQALQAQMKKVYSITVDGPGNVYLSNYCGIRRIDTSGVITTICGNNTPGYAGDNGPAVDALMTTADGLCAGPDNALFVSDSKNNVIRRISAPVSNKLAGTVKTLESILMQVQNPNNGIFLLEGSLANTKDQKVWLRVCDRNGVIVYNETIDAPGGKFSSRVDLSETTGGLYIIHMYAAGGSAGRRFLIEKN